MYNRQSRKKEDMGYTVSIRSEAGCGVGRGEASQSGEG